MKLEYLLIIIILAFSHIEAQINVDKDTLFEKYMSQKTPEVNTYNVQSPVVDSIKIVLTVEQMQASIEYYKRLVADYKHGEKVFEWQLVSSHIIFWVVIFLVLSGLVLSWLQFTKPAPKIESEKPVSSVLKFSFKSGIEVTSPVLGVIILVISMVFFYLYLTEVYQIRLVK